MTLASHKKGWGYGKWTRIETEMYTSKAWLSLGATSCKILILFLGKRRLIFPKDRKGNKGAMVCENCDKLTMTYIELESPPFNFTRPRIVRAFDELLAKGFITIVDPGGAYQKHKAVYALSDLWRQWTPGASPFHRRMRDAKRGFQDQGKGAVSKKQENELPTTRKEKAGLYNPEFQAALQAEKEANKKSQHTKTLPMDTH